MADGSESTSSYDGGGVKNAKAYHQEEERMRAVKLMAKECQEEKRCTRGEECNSRLQSL